MPTSYAEEATDGSRLTRVNNIVTLLLLPAFDSLNK